MVATLCGLMVGGCHTVQADGWWLPHCVGWWLPHCVGWWLVVATLCGLMVGGCHTVWDGGCHTVWADGWWLPRYAVWTLRVELNWRLWVSLLLFSWSFKGELSPKNIMSSICRNGIFLNSKLVTRFIALFVENCKRKSNSNKNGCWKSQKYDR